jgi:hypothetical protein
VFTSQFAGLGGLQARHACVVSEDLLGAIVALFFAHVLPDGHQVDFKALATSPDFQRFEEASAELQVRFLS